MTYRHLRITRIINKLCPSSQRKECCESPFCSPIARFFAEAEGDPYLPMYVLFAHTGSRHGEAIGFDKGDLDKFRRVIHVRQSVSQSKRKIIVKKPRTKKLLHRATTVLFCGRVSGRHRQPAWTLAAPTCL